MMRALGQACQSPGPPAPEPARGTARSLDSAAGRTYIPSMARVICSWTWTRRSTRPRAPWARNRRPDDRLRGRALKVSPERRTSSGGGLPSLRLDDPLAHGGAWARRPRGVPPAHAPGGRHPVPRARPADPIRPRGPALPTSIFTNAISEHAERVLAFYGIRDLFERVFDLRFNGYRGKPDPEAYRRVLAAVDRSRPEVLFVDDYPVYLEPFRAMGGPGPAGLRGRRGKRTPAHRLDPGAARVPRAGGLVRSPRVTSSGRKVNRRAHQRNPARSRRSLKWLFTGHRRHADHGRPAPRGELRGDVAPPRGRRRGGAGDRQARGVVRPHRAHVARSRRGRGERSLCLQVRPRSAEDGAPLAHRRRRSASRARGAWRRSAGECSPR